MKAFEMLNTSINKSELSTIHLSDSTLEICITPSKQLHK